MRFGLVGSGFWATTVHGPGLIAHPEVELVGLWGRDLQRSSVAAAQLRVPSVVSFEALVESVDALAFAVPPDVQVLLATKAASAGRHLLLEKPVALDSSSAQSLTAAVGATGVSTIVFFTARFSPGLATWFETLAGGDWEAGTYVELGSIFQPGSPYAGSTWRRQRGALWDIGPHALATLTAALGPAASGRLVRGRSDIVNVSTIHANGKTGSALLALDAPPESRYRSAGFYGSSGVSLRPEGPPDVLEAYGRAVDALVASTAGTPHPCDAEFGAQVVNLLESLERQL